MKKIIFYIIAFLNAFLILSPTTFALSTADTISETSSDWGYLFPIIGDTYGEKPTGSNAILTRKSVSIDGTSYNYYQNSSASSYTFPFSNFMIFSKTTNHSFKDGHVYSVQMTFCFDKETDVVPTGRTFTNNTGSSYAPSFNTPTNQLFFNYSEVSNLPYGYNLNLTLNKCYATNDIFVQSGNTNNYGVEFEHDTEVTPYPNMYMFGIYFKDLGTFPTGNTDIFNNYFNQVLEHTADDFDVNNKPILSTYKSLVLLPNRVGSVLQCYENENSDDVNSCLEDCRLNLLHSTSYSIGELKFSDSFTFTSKSQRRTDVLTKGFFNFNFPLSESSTVFDPSDFKIEVIKNNDTTGNYTFNCLYRYEFADCYIDWEYLFTGSNDPLSFKVTYIGNGNLSDFSSSDVISFRSTFADDTVTIDNSTTGGNNNNDNLLDDDVSGANDSANDLFNNFETEDFGISSIITAPLEFIQSLTSDTCQPLSVPIPFTDSNISLPCMTEVYEEHFGAFYDIYKIILVGFLSYRICLNVVRDIEKLKNPTNDKVEVVEL